MKKVFLVLILFFGLVGVSLADPVTFRWDPNDLSDNVIGYRLYQTDTSGSYVFGEDHKVGGTLVGTETITIEVPLGLLRYFVVTAYNPVGESGRSNEVSTEIGGVPQEVPSPPGNLQKVSGLTISNLSVNSGAVYEVAPSLELCQVTSIAGTYTFTGVPEYLQGAVYIKTANGDKGGVGDSFLSFDVNQAVTVYVGYDSRITIIPSWLLGFTGIGDEIVTSDAVLKLYSKDFSTGAVVLGGNASSGNSMYTVIIK